MATKAEPKRTKVNLRKQVQVMRAEAADLRQAVVAHRAALRRQVHEANPLVTNFALPYHDQIVDGLDTAISGLDAALSWTGNTEAAKAIEVWLVPERYRAWFNNGTHGHVWRLGEPTTQGHPRHPLYVPADTEFTLHKPKKGSLLEKGLAQ